MNTKNTLALLIATVASIGIANAATPGAYVGGGLGLSNVSGFTDAKTNDDGGLGGTLFVGYNLIPYFGIEAGYRKYAKADYQMSQMYYNDVIFGYDMYAFTLVGKGYLPIGENSPLNLFISLGAAEVYGKANVKNFKSSSSNNALLVTSGIGITYDINSNLTVSCEYTFTQGKSGNSHAIGIPQADMATLNLAYKFN